MLDKVMGDLLNAPTASAEVDLEKEISKSFDQITERRNSGSASAERCELAAALQWNAHVREKLLHFDDMVALDKLVGKANDKLTELTNKPEPKFAPLLQEIASEAYEIGQ